jgi:hypothetical protein
VIFEYCATFSFIIALAASRAGIGRAERHWLGESLKDAAKGIAGFTGLAALTGLMGLYTHDVVDILKTIVQTIFGAFICLFLLYLLYLFSSGGKTKAPRKRRTSQKRRGKRRRPLL